MSDLIARLEAASEGSRALDWEIHVRNGLDGVGMHATHPAYTTSLDAALTLAAGHAVDVHAWPPTASTRPGEHYHAAAVVRVIKNGIVARVIRADGHTAPLAICIAALRDKGAAT